MLLLLRLSFCVDVSICSCLVPTCSFSFPQLHHDQKGFKLCGILPSPRQLRMTSFDVEMPMVGANSYTATTPATPNPVSHPHAASPHAAPTNPHDTSRPFNLHMHFNQGNTDRKLVIPRSSRLFKKHIPAMSLSRKRTPKGG